MSWQRQWAADRLGAELIDPAGQPLSATDLLELAIRHNPQRAHLLVSRVLGKHLPVDPVLVYASSRLLGLLAADALTGSDRAPGGRQLLARALTGRLAAGELLAYCDRPAGSVPQATVIGFAETATGLGHGVADSLRARYLHSTRRPAAGPAIRFHEEHSHAVDHLLQPADPALLELDVPLVLVDDELSTGRTALNLIRQLQPRCPTRSRYLIAALVDLRSAADRERMAAVAAELGVRIEVVALANAELRLAPDVLARGAELAKLDAQPDIETDYSISQILTLHWPATVVADGRHGFDPADREPLEQAARDIAEQLAGRTGDRVLVLGSEELMYAPLRIATALAELAGTVRFSATTRSPVVTVDRPGYPIRTRLRFPAPDDPADGLGIRYAYNVHPGSDPARRFTDIVLVIDSAADTPALRAAGGLLAQLATATDRVWLVRIPVSQQAELPPPLHGPAFGSYRADEVSWLLTDLSGAELEAPAEEREEAIQAGAAHYAESLPIEYQPTEQYLALYRQALTRSVDRLAYAVGVLAELLLAERGPELVLASLARAGTPVGALIRRWAQAMHHLELPHYAISIVRGRGIDELALRYLASRYATERVVFVDGWTGKGAIARELATAVEAVNARLGSRFSAELAVLADPGHCARFYGTRADYLIPSACLNSTVSGLISRTVLNRRLLRPDQFHGAKFYSELAGSDVSGEFLDAVSGRFTEVADEVSLVARKQKPVEPDWRGWRTVLQLANRYGIDDLNLIKPGVGETTRVLLRRVPWKVLVRPDAPADLAHLLLLAEQRGVPVEPVDDLSFSSVGLIKPSPGLTATGYRRIFPL